MKIFIIFLSLIVTNLCQAETLSPHVIQAGKSVSAKILDANQNDVTSQYTLSYSGSGLQMLLFGGHPVVIGSSAGDYQIVATKISDSSTLSLSVSVTSGVPNRLVVFGGNNQSAIINSQLPSPIKVKVLDSFGNPVSGTAVNFSVTQGSGTLSQQVSNSNSDGVAETSLTLGGNVGTIAIKASFFISSGSSSTILLFATSVSDSVGPVKLGIVSQPINVNLGSSFSFSAQALLSSSLVDQSFLGSISLAAYSNNFCGDLAPTTLTGPLTLNSVNGAAAFTGLAAQQAGTFYIKVSSPGILSTCSKAINVIPPSTGLAALQITQLPVYLNSNKNLFPAIKVVEKDNNGQIFSSGIDLIQINSYSDSACSQLTDSQLSNNLSPAISGYSTFANSKSSIPQTIYIKAVSGSVSSSCSDPLVITETAPSNQSNPIVPSLVFRATYNSSINADFSVGSNVGTPFGNPVISGGALNLKGNVHKYVDYDPLGNSPGTQSGAIKIRVQPNYSGNPLSGQTFFSFSSGAGQLANLVGLQHRSDQNNAIIPYIFDKDGGAINVDPIGTFNPIAGTTYELELNYDLNSGDIYLFQDGIQIGHLTGRTGVRNSNVTNFRVSGDSSSVNPTDFAVDEIDIYNAVQHTSGYSLYP